MKYGMYEGRTTPTRDADAVARHGSVTQAAAALGVTQPAISIQMRKLEDVVGLPVFEKVGRAIQLTEAGQEVLSHAQRVRRVLDDLEESIHHYKGVSRGSLRIAVVSTANYFITEDIARFRRAHPDVEINLKVANRDRILAMLEANEVDLAITGQPPEDSDLVARPFKDNPLVIIAPTDHPLVGSRISDPSDLARFPFVVREPGSGTRAAMERIFGEHGVEVKISCVLSSNEAVKQAVQAGLGLAMISRQTTDLEIETGRLACLVSHVFAMERKWYVVYRNFRRMPPAASKFRSQLLKA